LRPAIHWWSNSPHAPTGYGTQTRAVAWRLAEAGYPVSIGTNYGLESVGMVDTTTNGAACPLYPRGYDGYSQDTIAAHWKDWARRHPDVPTLLVTLYDVWTLTSPSLAQVPVIASWTPIDHTTMPSAVLEWSRRPNVAPIAMSKFGAEQFAKHDVEAVYIPHTFEQVFRPRNRDVPADLISAPSDAFVVMMNAANKGRTPARKAWSENFLAVGMAMRDCPDLHLYVHTEPVTPYGLDLPALARAAGIPDDRVQFASAYPYRIGAFSDEMLATMYSRADVLLAVSLGEGFGIPTVEAQACGTRVIGSNATATPELVSADGWLVDGQPEWDPDQRAFWFRPHVHAITAALKEAYAGGGGRSHKAVSHVGQYAAENVVMKRWPDLIGRLVA
jgi:hypothetical protein